MDSQLSHNLSLLKRTFRKFIVQSITEQILRLNFMDSDITIKENKESILLSGANMIISCLRADLFQVLEAMLEALCLLSWNK